MQAEYLEGRHALVEALDAHVPVSRVFVAQAARRDNRVEQTVKRAMKQGADIVKATPEQLDAHSSHGAHQGIIAQIKPFRYCGLDTLVQAAAGKRDALIVATDHVTDAGNFGAVCRSAEVVGACGVLVPNKRQAGVTTATYKTSAGAVAHLAIAREANLASSLEALKDEGFWVIGASEHAQTLAWDASLSGRIALVMGSESKGLSERVARTCDVLVKLPQAGRVESLNVAQAATTLMYEWARQCHVAQ